MFDFVWHLRGSVPLKYVGSNSVALDRVERLLVKQYKTVCERGSDYLVFDNPLWSSFGSRWAAMVIYERGRFWIKQDMQGIKLHYDLRSLHGFVFCLFAALIAFATTFVSGGFAEGLKFGGGAFAWLYGANIMLAFVRVPYAIRNAASSAN